MESKLLIRSMLDLSLVALPMWDRSRVFDGSRRLLLRRP
jgi:hypothetical protein